MDLLPDLNLSLTCGTQTLPSWWERGVKGKNIGRWAAGAGQNFVAGHSHRRPSNTSIIKLHKTARTCRVATPRSHPDEIIELCNLPANPPNSPS